MGIIDKDKFTASLDSRHTVSFAHIFDMAQTCDKRNVSVYGDFLSENSISALLCRKKYLPMEPVLFGGIDDVERQMVAFIADYDVPDFPVSAVKISSPRIAALSHRDFLGSILGLGIKREKCGDIIMLEDACYVLCHRDISSYIASNLTKVGREGVRCTECEISEIPIPEKSFEPVKGTVATLRLDAVVALFAGKGRSRAVELISAGFVFVNGIQAIKNDMHLSDGDIISVRGCGKAVLDVSGKSKKDRTFITLNKYS